MREDAQQLRSGSSAQVMAAIRTTAIAILRMPAYQYRTRSALGRGFSGWATVGRALDTLYALTLFVVAHAASEAASSAVNAAAEAGSQDYVTDLDEREFPLLSAAARTSAGTDDSARFEFVIATFISGPTPRPTDLHTKKRQDEACGQISAQPGRGGATRCRMPHLRRGSGMAPRISGRLRQPCTRGGAASSRHGRYRIWKGSEASGQTVPATSLPPNTIQSAPSQNPRTTRARPAIAMCLFITEKTVSKHAAGIFAKLDLAPTDDDNRRVLAMPTWKSLAQPHRASCGLLPRKAPRIPRQVRQPDVQAPGDPPRRL